MSLPSHRSRRSWMVLGGLACPTRKVIVRFALPFLTVGPLSSCLPQGQFCPQEDTGQSIPGACLELCLARLAPHI